MRTLDLTRRRLCRCASWFPGTRSSIARSLPHCRGLPGAAQALSAEYGILAKGQRSSALIREGSVDIMQSAVSSNWKPMEQGESPLPVHFAQINQRDGFFLVAREPDAAFEWNKLAGQAVLADHAAQPFVMLKYAARSNGVEWAHVDAIDAGAPEEMARAFRQGRGAYVHLQSPAAHQLECDGAGHVVVSVGASMPPVAFSSLCCSRDFAKTETFRRFVEAYGEAREWVRTAPAEEVARAEAASSRGIRWRRWRRASSATSRWAAGMAV